MSDKSDVSSWFHGGASRKSDEGVSGEMVDGLKTKTLIENPGDKGILSDGVRVSKEPKVLVGESNPGILISGTEFKSVESNNLETNNKNDSNENRVVKTVPRNNIRWESWGVMKMVGRVLDGRLHMDNEVEDVDDSVNQAKVNLVADKDAWQDAVGVPESGNKIDFKRTDTDNDSVKLGSSCSGEGSGLNGNQDLISCETVLNEPLESEEEFNDNHELFIPKTRGEQDITEKEGKYYVSDLVWGKVRSHPWWPGQIFSPLSATDKAAIHLKNGNYLIAYFGDQTFAWNEESKIKPFRMYFSEMEKQSSSERFSHAVQCAIDEAARRVEFGLSCPCLPLDVLDGIKFQVIENAGIQEKSSRRPGGDNLSGAATFSPGDMLQFLESLAQCPQTKPDRLLFSIAKAQLLAYNRWKGRYLLAVYEDRSGLLNCDTLLNPKGEVERLIPSPVYEVGNDVSSKKRKSTARDCSSRKRKNLSGDEDGPKIKEKSLLVLMSSGSSSSQNYDKESLSAGNVISSGENREMFKVIASNSKGRRGRKAKSLLSTRPSGEPQTVEMIPAEIPTPDLVLSKLILAAKNPMQGRDAMISVVGLLREFRNSICPKKSGQGTNVAMKSGKRKREQPSDFQTADEFGNGGTKDSYWTDRMNQSYSQDQGLFKGRKPKSLLSTSPSGELQTVEMIPAEILTPELVLSKLILAAKEPMQGHDAISVVGVLHKFRNSICLKNSGRGTNVTMNSGKHNREQPSNFQNADTFENGGTKDSYWTDRIIQSYSQDPGLFKSQKPNESGAQPEADVAIVSNLDDNKERKIIIDLDLESHPPKENPSPSVDEPLKDYSTALILNFTNLEAIPSITDLNKIFSGYGSLIESETKILSKSKRAKVIFKRKEDAETAFSSTGKYSIFGPALVSYKLNYVLKSRKTRPTSKKNKKINP